jgi:hypothetical protein
MYIYFLPLANEASTRSIGSLPTSSEAVIHTPTPDGGVEHTAARFLPASKWLEMAGTNEIILFPPQYFLLYQVSRFLTGSTSSTEEIEGQRSRLRDFAKGGDPPWAEVCISPGQLGAPLSDGRAALTLESPGNEVAHLGRKGVKDWVVLLGRNKANSPTDVEIRLRKDFLEERKKANL